MGRMECIVTPPPHVKPGCNLHVDESSRLDPRIWCRLESVAIILFSIAFTTIYSTVVTLLPSISVRILYGTVRFVWYCTMHGMLARFNKKTTQTDAPSHHGSYCTAIEEVSVACSSTLIQGLMVRFFGAQDKGVATGIDLVSRLLLCSEQKEVGVSLL